MFCLHKEKYKNHKTEKIYSFQVTYLNTFYVYIYIYTKGIGQISKSAY